MTRTITIIAIAASASLAGCDNSDHTIVAGEPYDPQAEALANAAPVELPPAIAASKVYRCRDNSVVYIDWLADNRSAQFRPERNVTPVPLQAPEPGEPLTAEGYSLTGTATASTITLTRPEHGTQTCSS